MDRLALTSIIDFNGKHYTIFSLKALEAQGMPQISSLPFSVKVLLENVLRNCDGKIIKEDDVLKLARWQPSQKVKEEMLFYPSRVIMQDFTGVPAVVDLTAMRDAMKRLGRNPEKINPGIPVDLVIDHSIQVDFHGTGDSYRKNREKEYERNHERYRLLKWAQRTFDDFRIFPPGSGIIHQVNLEFISGVVSAKRMDGHFIAFPETLVGTDSHTTMINAIGILGWGVGGIEAEAVLLGQPYSMSIPEVIGVNLSGKLREGVTATDCVLHITDLLRKENVVDKFVEFHGPGLQNLSLPDRATISNMAPEYGATAAFFPIDEKVLEYLSMTNRGSAVPLVRTYAEEQLLFYHGHEQPRYTKTIGISLDSISPSIAGPSRPQDKIVLSDLKESFAGHLKKTKGMRITFPRPSILEESRYGNDGGDGREEYGVRLSLGGQETVLADGSVVIAAITSCTNTSNPAVMIGAGILARNACKNGLAVKNFVKTSFAPGSRVVEAYLRKSGLLSYLDALGFNVVGYGCTTCIGNSGPLDPSIEKAITEHDILAVSVLSGNRNFEARIHPKVKANYLASPPLVVAFAIAGRIDIDLAKEPLGRDSRGNPVFLKEIWPSTGEIDQIIRSTLTPEMFKNKYSSVLKGDAAWRALTAPKGSTFPWDRDSTYVRRPPFFDEFNRKPRDPVDLEHCRILLALGDSITTDHISPAGSIPEQSPAGKYLMKRGIQKQDFNSYGSRRGNHEVMIRGTFANVRLKNRLVHPKEGGITVKFPEKIEMSVYEAALAYQKEGIPLIVFAGKEYGSGSSRDWAAKGTSLLGIKAIVARSYERIHRSNLIGMGVLPLQLMEGESFEGLNLRGDELFSIKGICDISPGKLLRIEAVGEGGRKTSISVIARIDTEVELEYFLQGGILPYVLRTRKEYPSGR